MPLKGKWKDKVNGVDINSADDINQVAHAVIELEEKEPTEPVSGDYIPAPATATVGQTIKVSAVDESGKPTAWEAVDFPEGGGGVYPVVDMTDTAAELLPNTFYKWGEVSSLSVALVSPVDGITNEYCFEFVSGSTATELTVPSSVKWVQTPSIEAGKTYQVSILNGIGVIVGA